MSTTFKNYLSGWIRDNKYTLIGEGSHGLILEKEPNSNTVLKVISDGDKAGLEWIWFCRSRGFSHLPKFYGKVEILEEYFYVVEMERLVHPDKKSDDFKRIMVFLRFFEHYLNGLRDKELRDRVARAGRNSKAMKPFIDIFLLTDEMLETLYWLNDLKVGYKDFHWKNVMIRPSTRDIVLTDPVSGSMNN